MTNGQIFGLARICTGGECIVSMPTWEWLIAHGAVEIVDGKPEPRPNRAFELLLNPPQDDTHA